MAHALVDTRHLMDRAKVARQRAVWLAALLLALTAGIHASVVSEHLHEWWAAGVFFLVVAAGQGVLAGALFRRPTTVALLAAIWSSVALVGVYVWSRTAGIPFAPVHSSGGHGSIASQAAHAVGGHGNGIPIFPDAPSASSVEPVGGLDLTALLAELAVIAILVYLLPARSQRWTCNAILASGLTMWALHAVSVLP